MLTLIRNPEAIGRETFETLLRIAPEAIREKVRSIKNTKEKQRSLISWLTLIYTVKMQYGIVPDCLMVTSDEYGKPFFKEYPAVNFSLSHCEGLAACVTDRVKVGLDVENVRPIDLRTAERVCSPSEYEIIRSSPDPSRDFFRFWTLKESCVKAFGRPPCPIDRIEFRIDPPYAQCCIQGAEFELFEGLKGYIVASCRLQSNRERRFFS